MPVTFEPAAPTGNAAAASYGAAQQNAQDIGATANLYEAAARMQMQNQQLQQAGQEAQQRGNAAATAAQLEDRHQQQAVAGQQDQTALGYAALQQRGQEIDQHAQAQAWVSKQDMTYADQLRMNRMQQAVSEVEDAYQQKKIDPETYTAAVMQIRTGLDPLRMKYEQQQAAHLQKQNQMIDAQMAQQAAHQATFKEMQLAAAKAGRTLTELPGLPGLWSVDKDGLPYRIGTEHPELIAAKKEAAKHKSDLDEMKADQTAEGAFHKAYEELSKHFYQQARDKAQAVAAGKPDPYPGWDPSNIPGNVQAAMKEDGRFGVGTLDEFRQKRAALKAARSTGAGGSDLGGGGDYGGGPTSPPTSPAPPPVPEAESKPFDLTKPGAMHPKQRAVVDVIWNARNAAVAASPAQAERWTKEAEWARATVAKYGNYYKIPDAERAHYDRVLEELGRGAAAAPPAAGRAGLTGPPGTGPIERVQRLAAAVSPAFN